MGLQKNVASQKIAVYAHDTVNDVPKTGNAASITAQISKDFGAAAATNDVNPTELDATDHPGIYVFDLTQAETNAENVLLSAVSSTADIAIDPVQVFTTPPNFTTLTIANNAANASITHLGGDSQSLTDLKDFADAGYDPATNKVQGVVLVDTCTTNTDMRGTDNAAQPGDQMDLVNAPNATALNAIAVEVESHLLDEGDSQMLINAIVAAIGNVNMDEVALVAAIRADLERNGGDLDTLVSRLTSQRATNLDNLDAAVSTRLAGASYTAPDNSTISTINTKLGTPVANVSTDLAGVKTAADAILLDTGTDGVVVAASSKTGYALTSGERDSIAAALLDLANGIETSVTMRQACRGILSALAGKLAGAATDTVTIRNTTDSKTRITATVDASGNRSAVTLDLT